uniref:Uncharacterized protein n=1 Tax=Fagus sylvatica TaxID=28930 RepID=A0A2N9GTD4_FAGSY
MTATPNPHEPTSPDSPQALTAHRRCLLAFSRPSSVLPALLLAASRPSRAHGLIWYPSSFLSFSPVSARPPLPPPLTLFHASY